MRLTLAVSGNGSLPDLLPLLVPIRWHYRMGERWQIGYQKENMIFTISKGYADEATAKSNIEALKFAYAKRVMMGG